MLQTPQVLPYSSISSQSWQTLQGRPHVLCCFWTVKYCDWWWYPRSIVPSLCILPSMLIFPWTHVLKSWKDLLHKDGIHRSAAARSADPSRDCYRRLWVFTAQRNLYFRRGRQARRGRVRAWRWVNSWLIHRFADLRTRRVVSRWWLPVISAEISWVVLKESDRMAQGRSWDHCSAVLAKTKFTVRKSII